MKSFRHLLRETRPYSVLIFIAVIGLFGVQAPRSNATAPTVTISVVNNSAKEIRHLFLASAGTDNWGDDQISFAITTGTSRDINADWSEPTVKVIAEDEDGCFLTTTLDAGTSANWTITTSTPRNCGS
jgi:hypothetical protein